MNQEVFPNYQLIKDAKGNTIAGIRNINAGAKVIIAEAKKIIAGANNTIAGARNTIAAESVSESVGSFQWSIK